jgi:hypothetical protein
MGKLAPKCFRCGKVDINAVPASTGKANEIFLIR